MKSKIVLLLVAGVSVASSAVAADAVPAAGKILLQTEGFEIDFRNVVLSPLKK